MRCNSCGAELPEGKSYCADCGSRVAPAVAQDITMTVAATGSGTPAPPSSRPGSPSRSRSSLLSDSGVDDGRYVPGAVLLDRYRISGLIGRGGMGEVYRATDLQLGQQVALKFLPVDASADALHRFRAEVRVARQISHRNVCRVYDIGEVDGSSFLSMEYIQGEDLSSLLRRIGRVPGDKAIELARQICAGLAAAHEKGVLHRDLKPSNLLIDGEGSVVIVDFGLAAAEEIRAGTPAYMAPEQLEGREVTVRSDIYSLGLVLYELFSGRRALNANSIAELEDLHHSTPSSPAIFVQDLDPVVERVILQCLAPDPDLRPQTVAAVAAALPGGDPLAAALAAGETPSPAMVAAAGRAIGISPMQAFAALVVILLGMAGIWTGFAGMNDAQKAGIDKSPEVMADRVRTTLRTLGYTNKPADEMYQYRASSAYYQFARSPQNKGATYPPLSFYYRSSPEQLTNLDPTQAGVVIGAVSHNGPPQTQAGMIWLDMSPYGHLLRFQYVTPERDASAPPPAAMDWDSVLRTAGFDPAKFQTAKPEWLSDGATDERRAWTGQDPSLTNTDLRIEAASWNGRLVYFHVVHPWTTPLRQPRAERSGQLAQQIFSVSLMLIILGVGGWMARRNLLAGRGDRKGAFRLATAIFVLHMAAFAIGADHVRGQAEFPLIGIAIAFGLLKAVMLWVAYIAVEPITRKRWPQTLISWARLLEGRWRDPLVGRDLLLGFVAAVLTGVPLLLYVAFERQQHPSNLALPAKFLLGGTQSVLAGLLNSIGLGILSCLATFLVLFVMRLILRRDWLTIIVAGLLFGLPTALGATSFATGFAFGAVVNLLAFFVAARFGILSLAGFLILDTFLYSVGASTDFSVWYVSNGLLLYGLIALAAIAAFRNALAGRALFSDPAGASPTSSATVMR